VQILGARAGAGQRAAVDDQVLVADRPLVEEALEDSRVPAA
jgi:hypothetical protein